MRAMTLCVVSALVLGAATVGADTSSSAAASLEVTVDGGVVAGVETASTLEWRGLPYAAPPVGELRWRPPAPVEPWSGVRAASEFAPPCAQPFEGSEDCLYVNVFTPPGTTPDDALPVMVHLHGGSNLGFRPYQRADAFVRHGVIVVTLGYRLGVFGWLAHPQLSAEGDGSSGEYGLLDQIAALDWVQRNIGGFGGDPGNVTLFGESAGSFDATALVASPVVDGLFARAALQTTAYWPLYQPPLLPDVEAFGSEVAGRVGCAGADVVACLRGMPASALVDSFGFTESAPLVGGRLLPASPRDLLAAATDTMPLIVGSTREEAGFRWEETFTTGEMSRGVYTTEANFVVAMDVGHLVRRLYPVGAYDNALWATVAILTDAVYTCPVRALAQTTSGPVWRYLYSHRYDNDPWLAQLRAGHFLDDPIMWDDPGLLEGYGRADYSLSAVEEQLSETMTTYWTNFAKTGDPNGAGLVAWPQYSQASSNTLEFDSTVQVLDGWHDRECDAFDGWPLFIKPGWLKSAKQPPPWFPLPGPR